MLRRIREPFGKAGLIVAVIALVAALVGGAYAASGGLTSKQKKEVKKIAREFAGKDGAQGPSGQAGPQGQQGPKGDTGAAGANGSNGERGEQGEEGKAGKSVSIFELAPGNGEGCDETGGAKLTNGTETAYVCTGKDGSSGSYPATLPSGHSMTGYWEVLGTSGINVPFAVSTISFPLPLASKPTATVLLHATGNTEEQETKCPGSASNPEATAGVLCLYQNLGSEVTLVNANAGSFGAVLLFNETDEGIGSWAVKAP